MAFDHPIGGKVPGTFAQIAFVTKAIVLKQSILRELSAGVIFGK